MPIYTNPVRRQIVVCGRRFGKTTTGRGKLIEFALTHKDGRAWYLCQSLAKAEEEFETLQKRAGMFLQRAYRETLTLTFVTGSTVEFKSFEKPDNLRGAGLDFMWGDEPALFNGGQFDLVARPMLADRRGKLWLTGTFAGQNWYYREWLRGIKVLQDGRPNPEYRPGWNSWLIPSRLGPAFLLPHDRERLAEALKRDPELLNSFRVHDFQTELCTELQELKNSLPEAVWRCEIECMPDANAGCAFRVITGALRDERPASGDLRAGAPICAWDVGKVHDPSAIVVLDRGGNVLYAECLPLAMPYNEQIQQVALIAQAYGCEAVTMDITGAGTRDANLDHARASFPHLTWRGVSWVRGSEKASYVQNLDVCLQTGAVRIWRGFAELVRQLGMYMYVPMLHGGYSYQAPAGEHDDLVAALAMAAYQLRYGFAGAPGGRSAEDRL